MLVNSCRFLVGRLLEVRVAAGYRSVDDVDAMIAMIGAQVAALGASERFTIVADWRNVQLMDPHTAVRAKEMLASVNQRVVRSAILIHPGPTQNLQVTRLVREAENPARRCFTTSIELHAWLSEVLRPDESTRLRDFLVEP